MKTQMLYPEFHETPISWENFLSTFNILATLKAPFHELTVEILADTFSELERIELKGDPTYSKGIPVRQVFMNQTTFSSVRKWDRFSVEMVVEKEYLSQGAFCNIWGATIIMNRKVPMNTILITSDPSIHKAVLCQLNQTTHPKASELLEMLSKTRELQEDLKVTLKKINRAIYDVIVTVDREIK